jgi:chromosome segregation ATPase
VNIIQIFIGGKLKRILFILVIFSAVFLSGYFGNKVEDLEYELEETLNKLQNIEYEFYDVQSEMNYLETAIEELISEVNDFNYENWGDNVPEVEYATNNVESAFEDLKSEVNDIEWEF